MFDPPDGRRSAIVRHLILLGWLEFWFTALPGAICSSPLLFIWLSGAIPAFGYVALVMALPALLISVYFIPCLRLIRIFMPYEPQTLKGGSLLPLPAYSLADWASSSAPMRRSSRRFGRYGRSRLQPLGGFS